MQIIALEPPGNVARDLALYRRELFATLGEGSALALPEIIPVAFASPTLRFPYRALAECWSGVEGPFSSSCLGISHGLLYLTFAGPVRTLASRAAVVLSASNSAVEAAPFEIGKGVFLCRPADPPLALSQAERLRPPRVHFYDCALLLLDLRFGAEPYSAVAWRELYRAGRPSAKAGHKVKR
jgi:hypothetical protein